MSTTSDIQALRTELEQVKQELAQLKTALDLFIGGDDGVFAPAEAAIWRRSKRAAVSGEAETPSDTTVGRNLPAPAVRVERNNIGGAL